MLVVLLPVATTVVSFRLLFLTDVELSLVRVTFFEPRFNGVRAMLDKLRPPPLLLAWLMPPPIPPPPPWAVTGVTQKRPAPPQPPSSQTTSPL